jgi:flagellar hook-associated protein 3 FlgL
MRVTYKTLYSSFINNMNTSLDRLMDLNVQAQTQKKVNKPSDDPVGMSRILDYRDVLKSMDQYEKNMSTAKGWLGLSDETLNQISTIVTRAKELGEQAATGTVSQENREEISYEVRQLFEQMLSMANTEYDGKSIYAGQKTDDNAFEEVLWLTTNDATLAQDLSFDISGSSEKTVLVQFLSNSGATSGTFGTDEINYRYSTDGGNTFNTGTVAAGSRIIDLGGVQVEMAAGSTVQANSATNTNDTSGTWLWVRPTAKYIGDDEDGIEVDAFGQTARELGARALGDFDDNVFLRIDNDSDMSGRIEYSYSLDEGRTWVSGNTSSNANASNVGLTVPGGLIYLSDAGGAGNVTAGDQFVIHPRTAGIDLDISQSESIRINDVGKNIFGGVYQDPSSSNASPVFDSSGMLNGSNAGIHTKNLFETMGNLVAFLETNNQSGVQRCLDSLFEAQDHIMSSLASVGGRENRLEVAGTVLEGLKLNQEERLSDVEDVDISKLMTRLTQQQMVYQAVLKSSSMIMQMSLMKFM